MTKIDNLSEEKIAFINRVKARSERRSQFPSDMGFHPFTDKFSEGAVLKTPWLQEYLSFRLSNPKTLESESLEFIKNLGADASAEMNRCRGTLLGLAVGDALGVPLEFSQRDSMKVDEIIGGGPFNLKKGYWTDDTSMACCLAYSLINRKGFDAKSQMECYSYWYRFGAYSPTATCFDIGGTTRQALETFLATGEPFSGSASPDAAGNGSIMRLSPIVVFYSNNFEEAIRYAAESSRTTHQAREAVDACRYLAAILFGLIAGEPKEVVLGKRYSPIAGYWDQNPLAPAIDSIACGSYKTKNRDEISSSGYVVHTLEAALWAFYRNDTFKAGALEAVNLADDSDTVGAVYGQIAGAYYGETGIPIKWITNTHAFHGFYHFAQDLIMASQTAMAKLPR